MALDLQLFNEAPGTYNPQRTPDITPELRENNQVLQRTAAIQYQGVLDNIRRQDETDAANKQRVYSQLSDFSKSAFEMGVKLYEKRQKEIEAEFMVKGRNAEIDDAFRAKFQVQEAADTASQITTAGIAQKALANGASPSSAMMLQQYMASLNGAQLRGYLKGYLQNRAVDYSNFLNAKKGELQKLDPSQQQEQIREWKKQYLVENGLLPSNGVPPEDFVSLFDDKITEFEGRVLNNASNAWTQNQSEDILLNANTEFESTKNVRKWWDSIGGALDENGNVLSNADKWNQLQKLIEDGQFTPEEIQGEILSQPDLLVPGKTIGQARPLFGRRLIDAARQKQAQLVNLDNTEREQAADQAERSLLDAFQKQGSFSNAQLEQAKKAIRDQYGVTRTPLLDSLVTETVDKKEADAREMRLQDLASRYLLKESDLANLPFEEREKWTKVLDRQSKVSKPERMQQLKAIEAAVLKNKFIAARLATNPATEAVSRLVIGQLQNEFDRRVNQYMESGTLNPQAAVEQAGKEVLKYWQESQADESQQYYVDENANFPNYLNKQAGDAAHTDRLKRFQNAVKQGKGKTGKEKLTEALGTQGLIMTKDEAAKGKSTRTSRWVANQYRMSELDVINAQRAAYEIPPITLDAQVQASANPEWLARAIANLPKAAIRKAVPVESIPLRSSGSAGTDYGGLAALTRSGEGGWNSVNYGTTGSAGQLNLTSSTVSKIEQMQAAGQVFAVGAYQFTPGVLALARKAAGLPPNAPMSPANQTAMFWSLILKSNKRPVLRDFLLGKNNDVTTAHTELSQEWAAIQGPSGRGAYDGDAAGNYASISSKRVRQALLNARKAISGS